MDSSGRDVTPMQSTTYFRSDDGNSSTSRNIGMRYREHGQNKPSAQNATIQMNNNEFVFNLPPQVVHATSEPEIEKAVVQQWNKFFAICWLFAIFLDPLFFFLLSVNPGNKCVTLNGTMATTAFVLRSTIDFIFLLRMLLKVKFWLAYVAPENRVTGATHYFFSYFFIIDFFAVLPLPQIILLVIFSKGVSSARNLLQYAILVQYLPRLSWVLPLFKQTGSLTGLIFKSALGYFVSNMLAYVFLGHIIGSLWYSFGLQRVNDCFVDACHRNNITNCKKWIDCSGRGGGDHGFKQADNSSSWLLWKNNENVTACFGQGGLDFGIYEKTVNLTTHASLPIRYAYSLFWGFQQLSTLAGNLVPSYSMGEVVFTTFITVGGLVLLGCFIANMQNFLQALGRRKLELTLRRHDVEEWMRHHRLPEELRSHVRDAERFNWAATTTTTRSVVNKEMLMENLPEDLQRDIRRHLFKGVRKVRILEVLDEPIVDAICERLKTKTYVKGSKILYPSSLLDKMVFIIQGKMESIGEGTRIPVPLAEGDVCGEELLTWCLEHSSVNKRKKSNSLIGQRLLSKRFVRCLTNVEALVLLAADLEEVTSLFSKFLRSPRVQAAIRYESPFWRGLAAKRIQVAWRYKIARRIHKSPSSLHTSFTQRHRK